MPFSNKKFNFKLSVGKELPSDLSGYVDKIMSYAQYEGNNSGIAVLANKISKFRQDYKIPGDMGSDWSESGEISRNEITEEVLRRRSLSLREHKTSDIIPLITWKWL